MGDFDDPVLGAVLIAALAPLFLLFMLTYLPLVGMILSPVAGVVGIAIAMRKRLNIFKTALLSTVYSFASVFLWSFFLLSVFGKRPVPCYRALVHILTFMYWAALIILQSLLVLTNSDTFFQDFGPILAQATLVALLISALTWIVSLVRIIGLDSSTLPDENLDSYVDLERVLARSPSMMPFAFSSAWSLIFIATYLFVWGNVLRGQAMSMTISFSALLISAVSLIWIFSPWLSWIAGKIR